MIDETEKNVEEELTVCRQCKNCKVDYIINGFNNYWCLKTPIIKFGYLDGIKYIDHYKACSEININGHCLEFERKSFEQPKKNDKRDK